MKKIPIYVLFFLLCFFLLINAIVGLGGTPNIDPNMIGGSGNDDSSATAVFIPMSNYNVRGEVKAPDATSYLRIQGAISCRNTDRDPEVLSPWGDENVYSDAVGPGFEAYVKLLPLSFLYGSLESCEVVNAGIDDGNGGFTPSTTSYLTEGCTANKGDYRFKPWPEDLEPNLTMDYINIAPAAKQKVDLLLNRYEGDCGLSTRIVHIKEPDLRYPETGSSYTTDENNPKKYYDYGRFSWSPIVAHPLFSVSWDTSTSDCLIYGGNWSDAAPEGAKCCGDDWLWLHNLCLYSNISDDYSVPTEDCIEEFTNPKHISYDPKLSLDDEEADEDSIIGEIGYSYYFAGTDDTETDIGKWSNTSFCIRVNDSTKNRFKWTTVAEAANTNALICEAYLGYNWTGTKCCLPGQTYNDTVKECDAKTVAGLVAEEDELGSDFSSLEFEESFFDRCNSISGLTKNRACFQGRSVENNKIIAPIATPNEKSIYNKDGILYQCGDNLRCTVNSNDNTVKNFVICAYTNNSWYDYYTSKFLGFDTALAAGKGYADFQATVHDSTLPDGITNPPAQASECCLFNSCWNGTSCVEELSIDNIYRVSGGVWSLAPPNTDFEDEDIGELYICARGKWLNTDALFNWYHDEKVPGFCDTNQSCVCSGTPTTNGYDYSCGAANVKNGCTIKENFYINDHYCQSVYDQNSEITKSKWTSRTKLLAAQLVEIASSMEGGPMPEYTLFCDEYSKSLNYVEPLNGLLDYGLNSFCVLESSSAGRVIGTTFNVPDGKTVDDILFDETTGFVKVKLGETLGSCDNAIIGASTAMHGSFKQCSNGNNKIWYNNKTQTLIYAKSGLTIDLSANRPDYNAFDFMTAANINAFRDFIVLKNIDTPPGLSRIKYATDFSKLYISNKGGKKVFGVIETKYDDKANPPLSRIMAVRYTGFDLDCADIKAKAGQTALVCDTDSTDYYVMAKGSSQASFIFWSDLTAKLRFD